VTAPDLLSPAGAAYDPAHAIRIALQFEDESYYFRSLFVLSKSLASRAALSELPPGAQVAFDATPKPETIALLWALLDRRICAVPLHPRWGDAERARRLEVARPHVLLDADLRPVAPPRHDPVERPYGAALVFTSGTTGVPKAALLSRDALLGSARASQAHLGYDRDDTWLVAMPLAHIGALAIVTRMLAARGTIALVPRFDAGRILPTIAAGRATVASLVPAMLAALLAEDRSNDLARLRLCLVGGDACPPGLLAEALARGVRVLPAWGLTETCAHVATALPDAPGDGLRVLPGYDLRRDASGELCVRGPGLFNGYLGSSDSPFDISGYFRTGDIGFIDDAGHVRLTGRLGDRLISGGENVDPAEVEAALECLPGVQQACVTSVPDPRWGERIVALVHPTAGVAFDERGLLQAAATRISPHARPRRLLEVAALPVTPGGKLDRRVARGLASRSLG